MAQRLPRLPRRRPRRHPVRVVLRRLRLRHRDHPRPARRRESDPRGADPHLLRRRDLLRQRHPLRQGCHRRRAALSVAAHGLRPLERARSSTPYELKLSPRLLARRAAALARRPSAGTAAGRRLLRRRFGALAARARPPRHRRRRGQARGCRRAARRLRRGRPQRRTADETRRAVRHASSPPTSSSTPSTRTLLARDRRSRSLPAVGSSSACRTSRTGTRGSRAGVGRFDYDQRGLLDRGHVRFFTRRSFERLVGDCGLQIVRRDSGWVHRSTTCFERGGQFAGGRIVAGWRRPSTASPHDVWPTMFGYQFLYVLRPPAMTSRDARPTVALLRTGVESPLTDLPVAEQPSSRLTAATVSTTRRSPRARLHAGLRCRRRGRVRAVPARACGTSGCGRCADDRIRGQRQLLRTPGQGAVPWPPRRAARQPRHRGVRRRRAPLHVLRAVPGAVADADPAPHRPPRRQADGAVDARRLVRARRCADRCSCAASAVCCAAMRRSGDSRRSGSARSSPRSPAARPSSTWPRSRGCTTRCTSGAPH